MIEAHQLTRCFGDIVAVDSVSFEVNRGEIVGFLGLNGAGKTTTMRMLTSFLPATDGEAIIAGFNVSESSMEVRKRIGYLPERPPLYLDMTVTAYLDYIGKLSGMYNASEREKQIIATIDKCGLSTVQHRLIGHLSKGYKQRVGLAQALVHDPKVLILDEPTSGLDPQQIIEIRNLIKKLANDHTILLSTHILPEVEMTCERVLVISSGRLVSGGSIDKLSSEVSNGEKVYVETFDRAKKLDTVFSEIKGFKSVTRSKEGNGFTITSKAGVDIRREIGNMVFKKGWGLLEMKSLHPTLEDIFLGVIKNEDGIIPKASDGIVRESKDEIVEQTVSDTPERKDKNEKYTCYNS
jgi:ABC-2 type transport system ATP-binding protein